MADLPSIVRALAAEPDREATVTLPYLVVGRLLCRDVRALLNAAELAGLSVTWREERGWLESVFSVRIVGRARLVRRYLNPLLTAEEGSR